MPTKQTKKIFSITQNLMKHIGVLTGVTRKWQALVISRTCNNNQKNFRKSGIAIEEMHAIYHDKDSKTHWNDYLKQKETVYKDIHIHVLIKNC